MLQIAWQYDEATRRELEAKGFKRWLAYVRQGAELATPRETVEAGDSAIYMASRKLKPRMFLTTPTGLQVVLAWLPEADEAFLDAGFASHVVYAKYLSVCGTGSRESEAGDAEFRAMQHPPGQYMTTSWWGAGPD